MLQNSFHTIAFILRPTDVTFVIVHITHNNPGRFINFTFASMVYTICLINVLQQNLIDLFSSQCEQVTNSEQTYKCALCLEVQYFSMGPDDILLVPREKHLAFTLRDKEKPYIETYHEVITVFCVE